MPWRPRMMPPVGKSGPGMMLISSSIVSARIVDQRDAGVDHLAEIVRRDIGRHADRDAAGAVDQQVGKLRRQNRRLSFATVVVGLEVDGVLVEVVEQRLRDLGQAGFGVPHGGRRIAVHRAEIALPVDQGHAHGEILRHAHQRVVDRLVAVRVIFTDDVADGAGRFAIRLVPLEAVLVHARRECGDAPASIRRARPAAHGTRSRSWRNRGRSVSSRRGWRRGECRKAPAVRRGRDLRCRPRVNPVRFQVRII